MGITILPKTRLGWWTIGLFCLELFAYLSIFLLSRSIFQNFMAFLGFIDRFTPGAVISIGLISIIQSKERSILVIVATAFVILYSLYYLVLVILGSFGLKPH